MRNRARVDVPGGFTMGSVALAMWLAAPAAMSAQESGLLEEIIVTAQKRAESIQNVSISMTALSAEEISRFGFENAVQVAEQVPNFHIDGAFGPSGPPQLSIRGVTVLDFSDSNESSVSMYFDEIYKGTTSGQTAQLFDIERVEVLRGPQGTLYGRNTTGGVVHFLSNQPTQEFDAGVALQYGSFNQRIAEGHVSGPLSERVRGRVAMKYNKDDGYQTNVARGTDFAVTDVFAARALLDWDVTDQLTASGNVYYSNSRGNHPGYGFYGTLDPLTGERCSLQRIENSECVNSGGFRDPDPDPKHVYSAHDSLPSEVEMFGAAAKLSWDFDGMNLVSITGYETIDKALREDCGAAAIAGQSCYGDWTGKTRHQLTQELRLSGRSGSADWIVGAFYYSDEKFVTVVVPPFGGFGSFATTEVQSLAFFAQTEVGITDTVALIAGVRHTDEDRDLIGLTGVTDGVGGTTQGDVFVGPISDSISAQKTTGKIGLEWRPSGDSMVYASVSTGFKSGVFNTTLIDNPDQRGPVGEESLTAYEIGSKNTLWDRRARLNMSAFYYDYQDFQASAVSMIRGVPVSLFINAGDVTMYGAELELQLQPSERWLFGLGVGLLDTQIKASPDVTISGTPLNGKETPVSPKVSLNGLARYTHTLSGGSAASLQVDFSWKDDLFFGPDNDPFESQDAYALVNVRAGWVSSDEKYELSVFAKNVFDQEYNIFGFISPTSTSGAAYKVWGTPRWLGARLTVNF